MTSALHHTADPLRPEQLDEFLSRGWYRVGGVLIASRYYLHGRALYSTIWTRTPLEGWSLRRGQRKRIARLKRRFNARVVPFVYTAEHEALYGRYLAVAPGHRSESLLEFLGGVDGVGLFETWAVELREGGRLVAFSLFDVGAQALQSLTGVYDPPYAREGFGGLTLLLEALHGKERGFSWHYSGYVVPGAAFMDYKWAVSDDMEFLDPVTGVWAHRCGFSGLETPDVRVKRRLRAAADALTRHRVPVGWRLNELYAAPHMHDALANCLAEPLVIALPHMPRGQPLIVWRDEDQSFQLLRGLPVEVQRTFPGNPDDVRADRTWLVDAIIEQTDEPQRLVEAVESVLRLW